MAITREDKLFLTKHLSTMVRAGVPLSESLSTVAEQATPELRKILNKVASDVENGQSLGKSFGKYPKIFDSLFVSLINAGEASGTLDGNLKYLSEQQNKDLILRKKILGALLYPSLVIGATIVMGVLLSWFVLPQLVDLFVSLEVTLPLSTKILLWLANLMRGYGVVVVLGMVALMVGLVFFMKIKPIKRIFDGMSLKLPIVGKIILFGQLGLLSRNLGTLLASGLPVVEALKVTADTLDNLKFKEDLTEVRSRVGEGKTLFSSMTSKKYTEFSRLTLRMIEVGERSGKLEEMLIYLAEYYEDEIENVSKNLANLLEPVLLLFIGAVVAFVAMAIISPIYSLLGGIK